MIVKRGGMGLPGVLVGGDGARSRRLKPRLDGVPPRRPPARTRMRTCYKMLTAEWCISPMWHMVCWHGVLAYQRVMCSASLHALQEEGMRPQCVTDEERRKQTKEHM